MNRLTFMVSPVAGEESRSPAYSSHSDSSRTASSLPGTAEPLSRSAAESLSKTLKLVADPTRLQLLSMISGSPGREVTVGELTTHLGLRQPTISHHLRLMFDDGLLTREQRGRHVWYAISPDRHDDIADLLR